MLLEYRQKVKLRTWDISFTETSDHEVSGAVTGNNPRALSVARMAPRHD